MRIQIGRYDFDSDQAEAPQRGSYIVTEGTAPMPEHIQSPWSIAFGNEKERGRRGEGALARYTYQDYKRFAQHAGNGDFFKK